MIRASNHFDHRLTFAFRIALLGLYWVCALPAFSQEESWEGLWNAEIESPGGGIRFGLKVQRLEGKWSAFIVNGQEQIPIPQVHVSDSKIQFRISHYDSEITAASHDSWQKLSGTWRKRRGKQEWVEMQFSATRQGKEVFNSPKEFLGRWSVEFESNEDPAVAVFGLQSGSNRIAGTFLTTTGDYRYLDGAVVNGELVLSCFDGAHAFLFRGKLNPSGEIEGEFWSSDSWHEKWVARKDPHAKLPDAFQLTKIADLNQLQLLAFPDLQGVRKRLDAPEFAGKARIVYVFGSWCPNCHDAGKYLAELKTQYRDQELSILGLAFELTGDFERDANQVRIYLQRHGVDYPVLIAGLADKVKASESLPLLDRVRSYPTMIFIDKTGQVRAVHTGFTGPATGSEYLLLKNKFETLIDSMLAD